MMEPITLFTSVMRFQSGACGSIDVYKRQPLSDEEENKIKAIVEELRSRVQNGCTGCRYCMPCPAGVNIPGNFQVWNRYHMSVSYTHLEICMEGSGTPASAIPGACLIYGNDKERIRQKWKIS